MEVFTSPTQLPDSQDKSKLIERVKKPLNINQKFTDKEFSEHILIIIWKNLKNLTLNHSKDNSENSLPVLPPIKLTLLKNSSPIYTPKSEPTLIESKLLKNKNPTETTSRDNKRDLLLPKERRDKLKKFKYLLPSRPSEQHHYYFDTPNEHGEKLINKKS